MTDWDAIKHEREERAIRADAEQAQALVARLRQIAESEAERPDRDAIRKRCEAATKPPWSMTRSVVFGAALWGGDRSCLFRIESDIERSTVSDVDPVSQWEKDAKFVYHAREDVPALLDEVERLTAERNEARLAHQCSEGTLSMTVDRLGGLVENRPTTRVNFLQRVDELVAMEQTVIRLIARLPTGEDVVRAIRAMGLVRKEQG